MRGVGFLLVVPLVLLCAPAHAATIHKLTFDHGITAEAPTDYEAAVNEIRSPGFSQVCFGASDDPLPLLTEACDLAVSSIHSASGKVTIESSSSGKFNQETTGEYTVFVTGKRFRVRREITFLKNELAGAVASEDSSLLIPKGTKMRREVKCDGSRLQIVNLDRNATTICGLSRSAQYRSLLNEIDIERFGIAKLDGSVPAPGKLIHIGVVRKEVLRNCDCFVVEKSDSSPLPDGGEAVLTQTYWIAPDKGYAVLQYEEWVEGGSLKQRTLVEQVDTDVRDYGGGVWGPTKSTRVRYGPTNDGEIGPVETRVVKYDTGFQMNCPVSESDLSLEIPSGTSVHDETLGADYIAP